ncbi:V-type ATPase [Reticulomyxa filosa]|uniref:V-type proton ATPase subunit a n=1 Tax=Reticulomyxa filosa TaxID=46433 RepID=X6N2N1_RETFI|nr:V-type ATPase [Reticulomyxa filosa]|eukprot:ETO20520.1 V-type ATPase [Reticulomyxa filosa]
MKLSVIIGVSQMTFGLFLKLFNHIQENNWISILFEFIHQLIFMLCFFGYMVFYKWCINWSTSTLPGTPSLITVLIKMFLSPGTIDSEVQIFPNKDFQSIIQVIFLLLLVFSIPTMLCVKPLILKSRLSKHHHDHPFDEYNQEDSKKHSEFQILPLENYQPMDDESLHQHSRHDTDHKESHEMKEIEYFKSVSSNVQHKDAHHDYRESFGDIVIHQFIHIIEYVLGTISNIASYLRLWALSLAPAELSEVFFDKTLRITLESTGVGAVIMNVVSAGAFLMFTCGVLLIMDVLECFFRALCLHWVEFQNNGKASLPYENGILLTKCIYSKTNFDNL